MKFGLDYNMYQLKQMNPLNCKYMFPALNLFMVLFTIFSICWSDSTVGIQI
jgi:hypothetical protein